MTDAYNDPYLYDPNLTDEEPEDEYDYYDDYLSCGCCACCGCDCDYWDDLYEADEDYDELED